VISSVAQRLDADRDKLSTAVSQTPPGSRGGSIRTYPLVPLTTKSDVAHRNDVEVEKGV